MCVTCECVLQVMDGMGQPMGRIVNVHSCCACATGSCVTPMIMSVTDSSGTQRFKLSIPTCQVQLPQLFV